MSQMRLFVAALLIVIGIVGFALGQSESATIAGKVVDASGAVVPGAEVELRSFERGTTQTATTNDTGAYTFSSVHPGRYAMSIRHEGFRKVDLLQLVVNVQDRIEENFRLQVGSISESVTVEASSTPIGFSGTVGTVVDQQLIRELPLQGRSFQPLFQLTPGTVIASGTFDNAGQFSVNGQRTDSNYFTVDGASANSGIQSGATPSQSMAGALPAFGVTGGTNNLVSTDAVQEFAIQTSSFAPEYGRTPGAQVSIVTKSGTNEVHGSIFDYLRNDVFDANDWFADHAGLKKPALRQNDFGGTLGGPVYRNNTFFFFSYEGLRLRQPTTALTDVPSLAARAAAPPSMQPFFNAFPLPTGPDDGNGLAPADYAFSNPTTLNATSLRLDHHFTKNISAFARYNYAPSSGSSRAEFNSLNSILEDVATLQTLTLGLTHVISTRLTNDFRFNWTRAIGATRERLDNFGGATPFDPSLVIPAPFAPAESQFVFFLSDEGINTDLHSGKNSLSTQRQLNVVENVSYQAGAHLLKFGSDYRHLTPHTEVASYAQQVDFGTISNALTSIPVFALTSIASPVNATYDNYSVYVQDTWTPVQRLSMTYGLRWDYNPTPNYRGIDGLRPIVAHDVSNPAAVTPAPSGSPFYHATLNNFAPRLGLAYQLRTTPGWETVLKTGAGIFYDLAANAIGNAATGAPFETFGFVPAGATFPFSPAVAAPPAITTTPPFFAAVDAFPVTLRQPYSYHWNLSLEQAMGRVQTLTVGYVGSAGHSLIRSSIISSPTLSDSIIFIDNSGYSNYNSLQAQYRRRSNHGVDLLASYTYAHALDDASADTAFLPPGRFLAPSLNYGPGDSDIRHTAAVGLSYELPHPDRSRPLASVFGGWALDPIFTARSAPPVDVYVIRDIGFGSFRFRPDIVPGVPLYVDPSAPGGRRINPDAFTVSAQQRQGTLSRNSLRGYQLTQADVAIRRRFALTERVGLDARLEAFNLLNHPNFAPPRAQLGTVDPSGLLTLQNGFGVSPSVQSRGFQNTSIGSGFNPLYQIGGPRSLQLALKLEF